MSNKFSLISLGCPKNLVDSDKLMQKLIRCRFSYSYSPEDADILLINTCGFINDAKKESIEEILGLAAIKKGTGKEMFSTLESSNPHRLGLSSANPPECGRLAEERTPELYPKLIVFGCLAKRYKNDLIKEIPEIDAIFGVGEEDGIVEYCKDLVWKRGGAEAQKAKNRKVQNLQACLLPDLQTSYAYLKIAEGCSNNCTYCVIPSIRGKYKSVAPGEIIKDAERHIKSGAKELILVAQDTAHYGNDLKGCNISSLLKDICSIKGDFWVRLLYVNPSSINDSLLKAIAGEDKICKYLDIPLQHSENRILRLMGRSGSRKEYLKLIKNIKSAIPDIVLRTTFILGFPSETETEFRSLLDFISEAQFDRLGAFRYSKEEGTPASKLKGHLAETVKKSRLEKLMQVQARISLGKNKELIGKKFRAIVDEIDAGTAIARLYSHAPEIDGVVIVEKWPRGQISFSLGPSKPRTPEACSVKAGDFINVEITDAFEYDLKGIIIK